LIWDAVKYRLAEVLAKTVKRGRPKKDSTMLSLSNGRLPKEVPAYEHARLKPLLTLSWEEIERWTYSSYRLILRHSGRRY